MLRKAVCSEQALGRGCLCNQSQLLQQQLDPIVEIAIVIEVVYDLTVARCRELKVLESSYNSTFLTSYAAIIQTSPTSVISPLPDSVQTY